MNENSIESPRVMRVLGVEVTQIKSGAWQWTEAHGAIVTATLKPSGWTKASRDRKVCTCTDEELQPILDAIQAAQSNGHTTSELPPRPPRCDIEWNSVLGYLIARPQWLLWRYEYLNGKWTKPPYQPNRCNGSSTDSETWSDWEMIQIAFQGDTDGDKFFSGIGFALTAELGIVGFDFDHCYDPATGLIDPTIARFLAILNSYTEITPGGDGFRVFIHGVLPPHDRKRGDFPAAGMASECYSDGRYLTITGHRFGEATEIVANQEGIDAVHSAIFAERIAKRARAYTNGSSSAGASANISDQKLLTLARKAANGIKFTTLYDAGDWNGAGFASRSEADVSLCNMLAFWTGRDAEWIDRLFRGSGLMREKWNREDYRARTIEAAIASCTEVYGSRKTTLNGDGAKDDPGHESDEVSAGPEPEPPVRYSDIAINNRYSDRHEIDLRFINQHSLWLNYSENYWKPDQVLFYYTLAKRLLTELANEAYREMTEAALREKDVEAERIRKAARGLATALTSSVKVNAVVTLARSHPKIAASQEQFDRDNWLLNTLLGAVNLRTSEIREHRRDDYCTKITPVGPVEMETSKFDKFLRQIMGSEIPPEACKCAACVASVNEPNKEIRQALHDAEVEALVEYLWRLYGYCLTGDVRAHILILEIGEGGNGKGVLNDFMSVHVFGQRALDGYSCEMPMEALIAPKGGDRHPTELMDLWHSRLAIARESEDDTRWNEGRVKKLSGGDPIKARHMRQDFVEFDATHKLIVFGQVKPTLRGASQAAWLRRLHLIPFPQRFAHVANPTKHVLAANPSLIDELATEAPGVLSARGESQ